MIGPKFVDMLGQEIRVGDTVAYSIRVGNVAETKVATVLMVEWHEKMDGGYWEWKVQATHESGYGPAGYRLPNARPSSPSVNRAVRVAKGSEW